MKGLFRRVLCVSLAAFALMNSAACREKEQPQEEPDKFAYYPAKTDIKADGQFYGKEGVEFPASLWQTPAAERCEALDCGEIKAYFIRSVQDTEVFCYVGIPEGASESAPVPAVVLVHGATGTAFYDWVKMWTDRGYAAIAMDTEGRMPGSGCSTMNPVTVNSVKPHGPVNAAFTDAGRSVEQQWVYHALASVIASASFIGSFPAVDETKIGITGVSYGSFLACLAAAYDDRYSFAVPVYGALSNARSLNEFGTYLQNGGGKAIGLWDDESVLHGNRTPFLFVGSIDDVFFAPDAIVRTAAECRYAQIAFLPHFTHGHYQGAAAEEVFAFADEIFFRKDALLRVKGKPSSGVLTLELPAHAEAVRAEAYYTYEDALQSSTLWLSAPAEIVGNNVVYNLDADVKHCYVRVQDGRGRHVCSAVS